MHAHPTNKTGLFQLPFCPSLDKGKCDILTSEDMFSQKMYGIGNVCHKFQGYISS